MNNTNTNTNIKANIEWIKLSKEYVIDVYFKAIGVMFDPLKTQKVYIPKGKYDNDKLVTSHIQTNVYSNYIECMIMKDRMYTIDTLNEAGSIVKGEISGAELITKLNSIGAIDNRGF